MTAGVIFTGSAPPAQFINPRGCEAAAGETVLHAGQLLDYSGIALLAAFGFARVAVYRKPAVAILATGDEIVAVNQTPRDFEIRNSNAYSLAAQVLRAGGVPKLLPIARDSLEETIQAIELGLRSGLLLLSGGVSAGKYDVVEPALAALGAEFFFDRVLIQPGQPVVFGRARERFFFGLPGNPSSTMVTFEIFARRRARVAERAQPNGAASAVGAPYARFYASPGTDSFSACVSQRRWRGADSRSLAWLRRHTRDHSRQCLSGGVAGLPYVSKGRLDSSAAQMKKLSHFDSGGSPRMVDVSAKPETKRTARAHAFVRIAADVLGKLPQNPKGNPLEIARIAGISAAKRTSELIPLCHPLMLSHADVEASIEPGGVRIVASATTTAQTGVEMEALTAAAVAALTVYDMTKALDKSIEISELYLLTKTGGKSGDYRRAGS